ncbi:toxin glutamine deamidase domain-containing protein [Nocardia sp. NPDC006630]|uniref:toxin glutamine deamidase domain-containing protein n=1 Tax=Nocardia sp. NPDC006630 TaxID=3157181 RepID=UPI0033AC1629
MSAPAVPLILCRSGEYHSAAAVFGTLAQDADTTHIALLGVLNACAGMAGSDSIGQSWATSYDDAVGLALAASERLITASSTTADLITTGAHNHETGEAAASFGNLAPPLAPSAWPVPCVVTQAASAAGDGLPEPFGWSLIKDLVGAAWPNGHQDELRSAQTAWFTIAADLCTLALRIPEALTLLGNQQSPEIPTALTTCTERQSDLNSLADISQTLGDACGDYAKHLDDAHHQILDELEEFALESLIGEGLFAAATPFTAGLSEYLGNAALAARLAAKARRVASIITELATRAAAITTKTLKPLLEHIRPLVAKIGKWVDDARVTLLGAPAAGSAAPADEILAAIRTVNPGNGTMNCVNCVVTTDRVLDGLEVSAPLHGPAPIAVLEEHFGAKFAATTGRPGIEQLLSEAGDGARGVVFASNGPGQVGHVFNVINEQGTVRFLDGQSGGEATFDGFKNFYVMRYR